MTESSQGQYAASFPTPGMAPPPYRNALKERLLRAKREAIEDAMGKGESWLRKLLNGDAGLMLDDLPKLMSLVDLKQVDQHKQCVNPELARAFEAIVRKATQDRSLLFEDSE